MADGSVDVRGGNVAGGSSTGDAEGPYLMLARVALLMIGYVVVGGLLAIGEAASPEFRHEESLSRPVVTTVTTVAPVADAATPVTVAANVTTTTSTIPITTSTVPWVSARLGTEQEPGPVPVQVSIPSLKVVADINETGVDPSSGQMTIPERADEIGWYRFGPRPGEDGSAVLAGHVDMAGFGPGAFYHLDKLAAGDEVVISMSDGTTRAFEVVSTLRVPKPDLHLEEIFSRTGAPRLTLITCGGAFNETKRSYDDNVVTTLIPVGFLP